MKRFPLVMIMVCFAVLQLNAQNNNTTIVQGGLNTANANIAVLQIVANTDYTTVSSPTGTFGSSTLVRD